MPTYLDRAGLGTTNGRSAARTPVGEQADLGVAEDQCGQAAVGQDGAAGDHGRRAAGPGAPARRPHPRPGPSPPSAAAAPSPRPRRPSPCRPRRTSRQSPSPRPTPVALRARCSPRCAATAPGSRPPAVGHGPPPPTYPAPTAPTIAAPAAVLRPRCAASDAPAIATDRGCESGRRRGGHPRDPSPILTGTGTGAARDPTITGHGLPRLSIEDRRPGVPHTAAEIEHVPLVTRRTCPYGSNLCL